MDNQQPSIEKEWRDVTEYSNYEVNQFGEIRNKKRKQILKPLVNPNGYCYVCFNIFGKRKRFAIHRIVANAFIPNPDELKEVNHKDYNKKNNCVQNLEWVSSSQNKKHAYLKEENHVSRGKKVNQYSLDGEFLQSYNSLQEAAAAVGGNFSAISNCCNGKTKSSKGFIWKFSEGSTTKYRRKPSLSAQDSPKRDEDIV